MVMAVILMSLNPIKSKYLVRKIPPDTNAKTLSCGLEIARMKYPLILFYYAFLELDNSETFNILRLHN
jgi:hypothetical protein